MSKVLAILTSDWHLSQRPPVARSAEPDWFAAQARPLKQLRELQGQHRCPLIVAGDLFDRWNAGPEVINFAMRELKKCCSGIYTIPGQHDLAYHDYNKIKKTAYWTLVQAGAIYNLSPGMRYDLDYVKLALYGFCWGTPLCSCDKPKKEGWLRVAVVHKYCWFGESKHPKAEDQSNAKALREQLKGFDVAVFGDNHQGFKFGGRLKRPSIFNCGTLMRRTIKEIGYQPRVGLLMSDGTVGSHFLDCSEDKFLNPSQIEDSMRTNSELREFIQELETIDDISLDFIEAVKRVLEKQSLSGLTRSLIYQALGQ